MSSSFSVLTNYDSSFALVDAPDTQFPQSSKYFRPNCYDFTIHILHFIFRMVVGIKSNSSFKYKTQPLSNTFNFDQLSTGKNYIC